MAVKWLTTRKGKDVLYDDKTKKIINPFLLRKDMQDLLLLIRGIRYDRKRR